MELERFVLLVAVAVVIGAYGTLIGAGGGFILVPVLLFLYPDERTAVITSISLAVVFVNAASGALAYARQHRINYAVAAILSVCSVPGSIIGAIVAQGIPRRIFDPLFGLLLVGLSIYLFVRQSRSERDNPSLGFRPEVRALRLGAVLSLGVGFLSSAFGIGGGVMHVPMMFQLLKFPLRMATATSTLVLAIMSLSGTLTHIAAGEFQTGWRRTGALSLGVVVGAQLGAFLSTKIGGPMVVRLLAGALAVIGFRLTLQALG